MLASFSLVAAACGDDEGSQDTSAPDVTSEPPTGESTATTTGESTATTTGESTATTTGESTATTTGE
ncbi:MAG: hypothetical protein WKF64_09065, partial [Ilumatobacteraceae bacterium]